MIVPTPSYLCPACDANIGAIIPFPHLQQGARFDPMERTVCCACGTILQVTRTLQLRVLTAAELFLLNPFDRELVAAIRKELQRGKRLKRLIAARERRRTR